MKAVKRVDQQRHELKALRYLLDVLPGRSTATALPGRGDFQIPDCQLIYDALFEAKTQTEAVAAIRALDLEDTDIDSFLRLGGQHYYTYPSLVADRGEQFRRRELELID